MRHSVEQRRLLAVVVADIVGYSRLMAEDEADTFYRLKDFQSSLISPTIERNHGQIVKWTGDGFIGSFDSAVDAVRAAVEMQSGAAAAGAGTPDDRRIHFRIGINVGDVICVPGDVYGDTVNIAARLQTLAAPGGICISRGVRDTVRGKFSVEFENRGELPVKNIPEPVGAFNVIFDPIAWTMSRDAVVTPGPQNRHGRYAAAAGIILAMAAAAAGVTWYLLGTSRERPVTAAAPRPAVPSGSPAGSASPASAGLRQELAARLASALPAFDEKTREGRARDYEIARGHKAQAAAPDIPGTWRATGRPTAENAETATLEQCQVFFGQPCILLAVDETVQPLPKDGNWPRRDMSRAHHAGLFEPEQIPGAGSAVRQRADIVNYRSAPAPKAVAYHPSGGRVFTVSGAATQRAAEEEVLKVCNTDPDRNGLDGSCFVYAVADQVVLPRRLKDPLTPPNRLRDLLAVRLASAVPGQAAKSREEAAQAYEAARGHKAQAASLRPVGIWRAAERPTADNAESAALEGCQIRYGQPCALLAVDDAVQPVPADGNWPHRDMPRAVYTGSFDPAQIPSVFPALRERADVVGYRAALSSKAAAFHPSGGRIFIITGAASQRAAEEEALKACRADHPSHDVEGPCWLYAVGDQVVLPRRLTEPLTAAPER